MSYLITYFEITVKLIFIVKNIFQHLHFTSAFSTSADRQYTQQT